MYKYLFFCFFLFVKLISIPTANPKLDFLEQIKNNQISLQNAPIKLHLGCGENHFNGYINIDYPQSEHTVQQKSGADIFADIVAIKLSANSIDEIRSHHVFEHFDRQSALALLCNWHHGLKIGGLLIIETPDFEGSAQLVLQNNELSYKDKQAILRHIFGSHEARWAIHCDGWYEQKFRHVLTALGFEDIIVEHSRYLNLVNITVRARKAHHWDKQKLFYAAQEILRESLVADCETQMFQVWTNQLQKTIG